MEFSEDKIKIMAEALTKASNLTESEWLNMEKIILENYLSGQNENASTHVYEMWNQLYRKIEEAMDRMK